VEAIAAGNEIAGELTGISVVPVMDLRLRSVEVMHVDIPDLEYDLAACGDTRVIEILENLSLRVDGDSFPPSQLAEVDAMAAALEAKFNSVMNEAFFLHPRADTHFGEQINRALLQHTGPDTLLNIRAAAIFENDGFNALQVKKMGQHQTRGACAHDSDLRT